MIYCLVDALFPVADVGMQLADPLILCQKVLAQPNLLYPSAAKISGMVFDRVQDRMNAGS